MIILCLDCGEKGEKETMENRECIIETRTYDQDSEVCDERLCYVCKDGIWEQKGALDFLVGGP